MTDPTPMLDMTRRIFAAMLPPETTQPETAPQQQGTGSQGQGVATAQRIVHGSSEGGSTATLCGCGGGVERKILSDS